MITTIINFNSVSPAARYKQFDKDHMKIKINTPAKPIRISVKIGDPYIKILAKIFKALKASDSSYDIQFKGGK